MCYFESSGKVLLVILAFPMAAGLYTSCSPFDPIPYSRPGKSNREWPSNPHGEPGEVPGPWLGVAQL